MLNKEIKRKVNLDAPNFTHPDFRRNAMQIILRKNCSRDFVFKLARSGILQDLVKSDCDCRAK